MPPNRRQGHDLARLLVVGLRATHLLTAVAVFGAVIASLPATSVAATPPPVAVPPVPDESSDASETPTIAPADERPAPVDTAPVDTAPAAAPSGSPQAEPTPLQRVQQALAMERFGTAVVLCEEMDVRSRVDEASLDQPTRTSCGAAYLSLGDKLAAMGSVSGARKRWEQAAEVDPRLLDDDTFVRRMTSGETPTTPTPRVTAPERPSSWVSRPAVTPRSPPVAAKKAATPPTKPRKRVRPDDAGPRYSWGLGIGLGAGFDGVASLILSWMTDETLAIELAIGIIYPVVDTRIRWYGVRGPLTPVLGLGMTTPLGSTDRFGIDAAGFDALYELGESIHIDVGVAWTFTDHLDLFAGVAFVTPLDQQNPDTVVLFPQAALQLSWYF